MAKTSLIVLVIALILIVAFAGIFLFSSKNKESDKNKELTPPQAPELPEKTGTQFPETTETQPTTYNIEIKDFAFNPRELRIKKGDTIIWTNQDEAAHTATSDTGNEISSELLSQGQTYSKTFNTAGTYDYHCIPHPYMKGKVVVE